MERHLGFSHIWWVRWSGMWASWRLHANFPVGFWGGWSWPRKRGALQNWGSRGHIRAPQVIAQSLHVSLHTQAAVALAGQKSTLPTLQLVLQSMEVGEEGLLLPTELRAEALVRDSCACQDWSWDRSRTGVWLGRPLVQCSPVSPPAQQQQEPRQKEQRQKR